MTIQAWTLLFSTITSGLVLVGGIWLKYVVNQQLSVKDTTIETLNAAINLHEGRGKACPAIGLLSLQDYPSLSFSSFSL